MKETVLTLPELRNRELEEGWDRFTELLREDIERAGPAPPRLPALEFKIRKLYLDPAQIGLLTYDLKFLYYIYRGDVEWTEYSFRTASQYAPEMVPLLSTFFPDLKRIMDLYRPTDRSFVRSSHLSGTAPV